MPKAKNAWGGLAGTVFLILVAGCSSNSEIPQSQQLIPGSSPLDDYYDIAFQISHPDIAESTDDNSLEESISACMSHQGFSYFPDDKAWVLSSSKNALEEEPPDSYGIVPDYSEINLANTETGTTVPSKNQAYIESLTPDGRLAYNLAFEGSDFAGSPAGADPQTQYGCLGVALSQQKLYSETKIAALETSPYKDIAQEMEDLSQQFEDQPSWTGITKKWSDCMVKNNYIFNKPEDIQNYLFNKLDEMFTQDIDHIEGDQVFIAPNGRTGSPTKIEIATLGAEEDAIYQADHYCQAEQNMEQQRLQILSSLEKEFYDSHQSELKQMLDWYSLLPE